ncbi:hypothetical protein JXA85_01105 [Candidatus Woesearchaeota archaeon]|nr:hypothetical protein [Candidatus Woesearchaeota archaeon]
MSSEKKEVENISIIKWIAEKLKKGYSPLSIEEVLEEKGYNHLHAQELVKKVAEEGNLGKNTEDNGKAQEEDFRKEILEKKVVSLSFPNNKNIKKFFLPAAATLFALSLMLMYFGKEAIAKIIISFISLITAIIASFRLMKTGKDLFEIFVQVYAAIFLLSLYFRFKALVLLIVVSLIIATYLVKKKTGTSIIGAAKTSCVLFIATIIVFYAINIFLGLITAILVVIINNAVL